MRRWQERRWPLYEEDTHSFIALLVNFGTGPTHLVGYSDVGEVSLVMAGFKPETACSVATWGAKGSFAERDLPILAYF